jgi:hypothetical protein
VDQIVAELEEIVQCYWRMSACCDALPPDRRDELKKEFFDVFLANTTRKHGQPFLTQIRSMVLTWRSKKPTHKRIPARTLFSVALSRKLEKMMDMEDARLAEKSLAEVRAGGATKSLKNVMKRYGLQSTVKPKLGLQLKVCSACNDSPFGHCHQHMVETPR